MPNLTLDRMTRSAVMVDVRVTGGFVHHGLLVAPSPTPPGFTPTRGSWSIWQIEDGVFEHRE